MPTHLNIAEDPRDIWQKFRRKELDAILDAEGIQHPPMMPAISAREIARGSDINPEKYMAPDGSFIWPDRKPNPEKPHQETDVDSMKRTELIKFCKHAGIEWSMSDKKPDLQKKVRAYLES